MEISGDRQHSLKRSIVALRLVALVPVLCLGVVYSVIRTVYPHNPHQGPIALVTLALAFGVAYPLQRRILRAKAELAARP